jgi:hypothetical protein
LDRTEEQTDKGVLTSTKREERKEFKEEFCPPINSEQIPFTLFTLSDLELKRDFDCVRSNFFVRKTEQILHDGKII